MAAIRPSESELETTLQTELSRPIAHVLVSWGADGSVEGYVIAWLVADEMEIHDVFVAPAARRRGVGRALVSALVDTASTRGARRILLEVRIGNVPARALYEALGFREFHVRRGYYADGEDAVEMELCM